MEGDRPWAFTAPAFACAQAPQAQAQATKAQYRPAGWKRRRRRDDKHGLGKRRKGATTAAAVVASAAPAPAERPPASLANPSQLAPLRCNWPHPAVMELLVQQCWPAAGAAVLGCASPTAASLPPQILGRENNSWNCMLPSLSLVHVPLAAQHQALLGSEAASSCNSGSNDSLHAAPLCRPNVLVGYEDDWLEVTPEVLHLWQVTPLAPFAGPKPLLHYLVCPTQLLPQAQQFIKDVGSLYETCNLGSHQPAGSCPVQAFQTQAMCGSVEDGAGDAAGGTTATKYLAGLRQACEQLQHQLLLDPPEELQQENASLECNAEPAVLVYLVCPLEQPAGQVAALLEAGACLAPCTPLGAAVDAGDDPALLQHTKDCHELAGSKQPGLAPREPLPPDRPAGATPAADSSRALGGSTPPTEEAQQQRAQQAGQQGQRGQESGEQLQYHGAGQLLHQQQSGDYRQLPLRILQRPKGSRPLNIVLQVVSPQALADISGTAAKCTALALYSKVQHVLEHNQGQLAAQSPSGQQPAPSLPFCSRPLMVLAQVAAPAMQDVQQPAGSGQQQWRVCDQQPQQLQQEQLLQPEVAGAGAGATEGQSGLEFPTLPPRSLHCFYVLPPSGSSLLPLAYADSCGELLHAELLPTAAPKVVSWGMVGGSPDSLDTATINGVEHSPAGQVCSLVLRRCLELLGTLRAASSPPNLLNSVVIAGGGMGQEERQAWEQLVGQDPGLQLELPPGAELAVVETEAQPPARFAGPNPPVGCKLLMQHTNGDHLEGCMPQAILAWLPPPDSSSSLLPLEPDTVRMLHVALVAHCKSDEAGPVQQSGVDRLRSVAGELHGLAWLHAAFQGACIRSIGGGGQPAALDAHLPIHAALAMRLHSLVSTTSTLQLGL